MPDQYIKHENNPTSNFHSLYLKRYRNSISVQFCIFDTFFQKAGGLVHSSYYVYVPPTNELQLKIAAVSCKCLTLMVSRPETKHPGPKIADMRPGKCMTMRLIQGFISVLTNSWTALTRMLENGTEHLAVHFITDTTS